MIDKEQGNKTQKQTKRTKKLNKKEKNKNRDWQKKEIIPVRVRTRFNFGCERQLEAAKEQTYGLKPAAGWSCFPFKHRVCFFRHTTRKNDKVAQFEKIIGKMA